MKPVLLFALAPLLLAAAPEDRSTAGDAVIKARVERVLKANPVIDGHNDWAETLVGKAGDARWTMDLTRLDPAKYHTDITRLRAGHVGGQFWSVWVDAKLPGPEQVEQTLEQIGLMHDIFRRYPNVFEPAVTAADVRRIQAQGRIASMLGVEGGGQIDGQFTVLRAYRALGASYLTLTHSRTISWADSATDDPQHGGLTKFGEAVVRELNRLGMLVDLSHVSEGTMLDALRVTKAPVIFSHSGARAVNDHPRNVSDAVLKQVAANKGVVMVDYAPSYVSDARRRWEAARNGEIASYNKPPFGGLYIGQPDRAKAALAEWEKAHPKPAVTLSEVADHIDHVAKVAGHDAVGIGSDFDGVEEVPQGLSGVETYPALFAELARRGWSDVDLAKLARGNVLRVMEGAERVAAAMKGEAPTTATVAGLDGK
ncbi:membrane dipeptidase [Sphingomonas sp. Leaf357]|uniref:dipeptidase n=1 Tax=Sphingomonas sp. Leaf357 TaxID=1736350 RepID=UPI0006FE2ECD|nr:dipeptidase [Sphingomonas sp. Leaf357]KQS02368.1 membrane dipeptidase [Sphingomonas sp. Leaf357]